MKNRLISLILVFTVVLTLIPISISSATALDSRVEKAINWAISIANDNSHGYSQENRNGPDYDCSSFVSTAFKNGGFAVSGSLHTGNMLNAFVSAGFTKYNKGAVSLQRGDILLRPKTSSRGGHTELYIGNNQCVAAHSNHDGKTGDSGGKEINVRSKNYCTFCKNSDYTYVLRYEGSNNYDNYTYSFNFNANGGTLGSSGAFSVSYGEQFQVLNTTCTRSGYTWGGWNVKRNNDGKWYVDGQGWCTESQISSNGYIKKIYPNYKTLKLDESWISGITGNCSYTFYAIWYQARDSKIKTFFSPYGKGNNHITAMNNSTSLGHAQDYIYAWYILYDENTGDLLNTYTDLNYNVCMRITKPNGESYNDTNYQNADANWVGFTPEMSGEYTITITVTGGASGSASTKYNVFYSAELVSSVSSVSLTLNGDNTATVSYTPEGALPGKHGGEGKFTDSKGAVVDSTVAKVTEHYYSNGSYYVTFEGVSEGLTYFTYNLHEVYTDAQEIVASYRIPITVNQKSYVVTYNANGGSGAPSNQTKKHGVNLILSSTKPTRSGYTFLGWSTSSSATSATYQPGSTFSSNANTTLYAVWKANPTYSITYNANGGSGAPSNQTKKHGVNLILSSTKPTRSGYTFLGWSTSSSATSATYQPGSTFSIDETTTLYAVWKKDRELSSVSISSNPTKTKYYVGDSLSTSGLKLKLIYSDGTTETVDSGFTTSGFSSTTAGTKTVTVSYRNKTTTFTIAVQTPSVDLGSSEQTLEIDSILLMNAITDPVDAIVEWSSSNEEVATVTDGYVNPEKSGTTIITAYITYKGIKYSASCTVTVVDSRLLGDINADGVIDAGDAVLISRYDAGLIILTAEQLSAGDVNKDGTVDAGDAVIISRYDAGLIDII